MLSPKSVVCGLIVLFLSKGTISQLSTNFVKNWDGTKFANELAWLRCLKQFEAVKLTFYIGLQNGFDVNCLTVGLRLYLWPLIIKVFTVDKKLWYNYVKFDVPGKQNLIFALLYWIVNFPGKLEKFKLLDFYSRFIKRVSVTWR